MPQPRKSRTFKIGESVMKGDDVKEWQKSVKSLFNQIGIRCPIKIDGVYAQATRSFTASLCEAYGLVSNTAMKAGVTPELRIKLRNKNFTKVEAKRFESKTRKDYRAKLRSRWHKFSDLVHAPVSKIITDDWGWVPGVHDGIDVQSVKGAAVFAMVRSRVVDVRTGGWWGKAPSGDVSKGDGIVQLEVLHNNGPFKKGQHIGYGHCEQPTKKIDGVWRTVPLVKKGEVVEAGETVALVGLAVTPHIHLMVNDGKTAKGVGNINPRRHLDYAVKHG